MRRTHTVAALVGCLFFLACTDAATFVPPKPQSGEERESMPDHGKAGPDRPNVILIVTDDQRADQLDGMENLQRYVAGHGVTFRNAFVTTSLCCPSRASILTGQYSQTHGVWGSGGRFNGHNGVAAFDDDSTLATWLDGEGYSTSLTGKYLNGYGNFATMWPPGWDDWYALASPHSAVYYDYDVNDNGSLVHFGADPEDHSTTVVGDHAVEVIEEARTPFFLYLTPVAPHSPRTPTAEDYDAEVPEWDWAPSVNEEDVSDKPREPVGTIDMSTLTLARDYGYRSLLGVDRMIGRLVEALKDTGQLRNTVIIYTSDNGFLLGEHRLWGKVWPYEESIRVPLIVRVPWIDHAEASDALVLNIDVAPTIAALTGTTPGLEQDGRSLLPLLRDPDHPWRDAFLVEYLDDRNPSVKVPAYEALRTTEYLYVAYRDGEEELYDLARDPYQLENVADDPAFADVRDALAARLALAKADPTSLEPAG